MHYMKGQLGQEKCVAVLVSIISLNFVMVRRSPVSLWIMDALVPKGRLVEMMETSTKS